MADSADRTLFVGNLSRKVTDKLLYELFLQAGPLVKVHIPEDKATGEKKNFAFVEFKHADSVPYSIQVMDGTALYGQTLRLQTRSGSSHNTPSQGQQPMVPPPQQQQQDAAAALRRSQSWNPGDYDQRRGGSPQFHPMQQPQMQQVLGQAVLQGMPNAVQVVDPAAMDPRRDRILRQQGLMIAAHQQRSGRHMANPYGAGNSPHDWNHHHGSHRHGGSHPYNQGQGHHRRSGRY